MGRFGHSVIDVAVLFPPGSGEEWAMGDPKFAAAVYSSDYCRWDCESPDSVKNLETRGDLSPGGRRLLFAGTAACFSNLPLTGDPI